MSNLNIILFASFTLSIFHYGASEHLLSRGKPTGTQSVIYGDYWKTYLAVDGNHGAVASTVNTCSITQRSGNKPASWWVDLQQVNEISRLRITLRSDCCGERFKEVSVKVGPSLEDLTKCGHYDGPGKTGQVVEIACGKAGRFVLIELATSQYLGLCEVEVLGGTHNPATDQLISRGKLTGTQSVVYGGYWKTYLAVDGNHGSTGTTPNTCSITQRSGTKPASWWVDLHDVHAVSRLRITLRSDCCGERFKEASIKVGPTLDELTTCAEFIGPAKTGDVVYITCGKPGRFVLIVLASSVYLGLCEVDIYGGPAIKKVSEVVSEVKKPEQLEKCKFPFEYKGEQHPNCINANSNKPWCSLDSIYEGRWIYCEEVVEDKFDKLLNKQIISDAKIKEIEDKVAQGMDKSCGCQKELSLIANNQLRTDRVTADHERRLKSCDAFEAKELERESRLKKIEEQLSKPVHGTLSPGENCEKHGSQTYLFVSHAKSYSDAEHYCVSRGGHLATPNNAGENHWLGQMAASKNGGVWWYIGASDIAKERTFTNIDGSAIAPAWLPGQPDNAGNNEDCVHYGLAKGADFYKWNDIPCAHPAFFICEITSKTYC